jgi:hypothetical protein
LSAVAGKCRPTMSYFDAVLLGVSNKVARPLAFPKTSIIERIVNYPRQA